MPQETFGIESINIDGATTDPKDMEKIADLYDLLASYARNKSHAMRCRSKGEIEKAVHWEQCCQSLYYALPRSLRW